MQLSGNTILITGGGSGIGRELARRFHALGNTVIVAGRRLEALQETIAGRPGMRAMRLDVESRDAITAFARQVVAEHPGLNVLVNNAGIMRFEDISGRRDLADAEATVATNLLAPIRLTDALIESLKAQPNAAIVNVTSGLAFVPMARASTYSATKAALHSYTVSLRAHLRGQVEVIELAPPAVRTDLTPGQADRGDYQPLQEYMDEVMALFGQQPTPQEILVQRVLPLRWAERDGHFREVVEVLAAA
ncbi:SDR family oxidoreductase [Arenimonas fontis]|uniref:SDR family NAD(P)-dependent oxidoreductase n=1 Tax=Arenimonas fontis TaxID=2608255 RepID=A0A5B2ZE75_9GAMM|nr:SDR family oxidoreductase [Arenimonas fontis]KAA2285933.1 SDR family NAD(P)-dependent oxidoreductase [Arenimonas fontis]